MFNLRHPFFAPAWRRGATTAFCGGWTLVEALMGNAGWAVLFAGLTAFCVYEFYIVFDPAQYDKRDD